MEAQSLSSHQHSWWFSCFSLREKLARSHNKSDRHILQTCLEIAQKIVESDKSEYSILILLQIKKRLNILTQMDSNYLHSLMNQSSVEIRFAAACILGNKEQARYFFDKEFADEQKERFLEYPIYYLLSLD